MSTLSKLPLRRLGRNGPEVSALGLGTMAIGAFYGKTDVNAAMNALTYAADRGMTFWDCADIYGTSEATLGKWFKETGRRNEIFLATKFGGWDPAKGYTSGAISRPSYVKHAVKRSFEQLGVDHIDLFYQHRVDPKVPIEIVFEALREYVEAGKIKWLGLSECSVETLERAKAVPGLGEKLVAVQMEYSPFTLEIEKDGFAAAADRLGVSVVAYSPLGRGLASGKYRSRADFDETDLRLWLPRFSEENFPKNLLVVDKLQEIANKYGATPSQVTLAWILAEHPTWVAIPGSRTAERIEENARGAELVLPPEAIKEIRDLTENAEVVGARYPDSTIATVEGNCLPLKEWKGEENL
ncbi:Aldo/keto reductase [Punctularia strigosozonata HHB-11173 SS5]|uniref:Aldo/keto reductase n=1 Tax=Punctularia strigosozonata (strain HHB-11173) TaxID=741275 RepID=UPI000441656B|nr:Aldo/keto reductase [Punctularia strigosozonata HHB-11173 SS5]EIN12485.1 Aldo/keto reductase [Punctularia strigosozonata HHB-11173 SS5]